MQQVTYRGVSGVSFPEPCFRPPMFSLASVQLAALRVPSQMCESARRGGLVVAIRKWERAWKVLFVRYKRVKPAEFAQAGYPQAAGLRYTPCRSFLRIP
jgi:hypothetical protein